MSPYAIGLLLLGGSALGGAYWAATGFNQEIGLSQEGDQTGQVEIVRNDAPADEIGQGARGSLLKGSAARRMDDFGSGPGGVTVTVPLKGRHKQAFSGDHTGGGGPATSPSTSDGGAASSSDVAALQQGEGAETPSEAGAGEDKAGTGYQVIEREPADNVRSGGQADGDAGSRTPSFDIVRVDPAGRTVLAGRSAPLAEVEIKAGDRVIDRVTATPSGEWVSTPIEPLSSGDQELSLTALRDGAGPVDSRQIVVVSVPEPAVDQPSEQPVAVMLDKDEGGEGRILQAPDQLQSEDGDGRLALKLVDYDDEGAIRLSGEAPPGVPVRIYIDNEPAALVIGDSKGYWITTLDQSLPGGDYTLRLDQLDIKGQTVARLETPLTRVTTPPVEGDAKVDYVVVQPGNSLWRIARRLSGDGFNYVYIFEANEAQIRDPDIIYPGQVFEVPADALIEAAG